MEIVTCHWCHSQIEKGGHVLIQEQELDVADSGEITGVRNTIGFECMICFESLEAMERKAACADHPRY